MCVRTTNSEVELGRRDGSEECGLEGVRANELETP